LCKLHTEIIINSYKACSHQGSEL